MTANEFQHKYHEYNASFAEAKAEADRINAEDHGFKVVAVDFGPIGAALMLDTAYDFVAQMDVLPKQPE